jgi:hypothetical protein
MTYTDKQIAKLIANDKANNKAKRDARRANIRELLERCMCMGSAKDFYHAKVEHEWNDVSLDRPFIRKMYAEIGRVVPMVYREEFDIVS